MQVDTNYYPTSNNNLSVTKNVRNLLIYIHLQAKNRTQANKSKYEQLCEKVPGLMLFIWGQLMRAN